jgi:5-methylcytosine-specific restriction endonuclease McrA
MPTRPNYHRNQFRPARPENRPNSHHRGYDTAWRRLRAEYLSQHPLCELRDHPSVEGSCLELATQVDHRQPIAAGGARLDPANLRALCESCHSKVTNNYRSTGTNELPGRWPGPEWDGIRRRYGSLP